VRVPPIAAVVALLLLAVGCGGGGRRGAAPSELVVRARLGVGPTELLRAAVDGAWASAVPNTEGGDLDTPSGDGRFVVFRTPTGTLSAVRTADGTEVFATPPSVEPRAIDPLFGWFPGDPTNLFFAHETGAGTPAQVFADADIGGATHLNLRNLPAGFVLVDVSISPDGSRALLRSVGPGASRCDVISTSTGALVGGDLPVLPAGAASPMPRWLPDTSGLTFVDPGVASAVYRIDPDGDGLEVLHTAPGPLLDAVVAPGFAAATAGAGRVAYVREGDGPSAVFGVAAVAGGAPVEQDLLADLAVAELAWHPDGATVWCELAPAAGAPFTRVFDAATAATRRTIAARLGAIDVDRVRGDVVLYTASAGQDPQFPAAGLWRLAADGTGGTPVALAGGLVPVGPARFLTSWRNSAAAGASSVVR
jgi:hypothetical protein